MSKRKSQPADRRGLGNSNSQNSLNKAVVVPASVASTSVLNYEVSEESPLVLQHLSPAQAHFVWTKMETDGRMRRNLTAKQCYTVCPEDKSLDYSSGWYVKVAVKLETTQPTRAQVASDDDDFQSAPSKCIKTQSGDVSKEKPPAFPSHHIAVLASIHQMVVNGQLTEAQSLIDKLSKVGRRAEDFKVCHNCGHKGCCRIDHLEVNTTLWNSAQDYCHHFIEDIIEEHGSVYQNSEKFVLFKQHFCKHNCI
jgi:hypothetical protein